jgi:hypothetical protein
MVVPHIEGFHTKVHDDQFSQSINIKTDILTVREVAVLILLMGYIYDIRSWDGFKRYPYQFSSLFHKKKKVVGLERGPLSLVSTTEELPDRKVAAPV